MGNLAWSIARQAQMVQDTYRRCEESTISHATGRLAVYTVSFLDIGESLLKKLFAQIAEANVHKHGKYILMRCRHCIFVTLTVSPFSVAACMAKFRPQDLSNSAWAFSLLGLRHEPFLTEMKKQLTQRIDQYLRKGNRNIMTTFKSQELTNALWALATLNFPCNDLITDITPFIIHQCSDPKTGRMTSASIARVFKRQELGNLAWTCAVFADFPPPLIRLIYLGILGVGEKPDPDYLRRVFGDDGTTRSILMSITYLQIALDLADASNGLSLPADFPDRWSPKGDSMPRGMDVLENDFELSLKTSKIQRSVSSAFSRIGFEHKEEHVIGMDTLAYEHGIHMAPVPVEVLSLDIANVDLRIGVEVDGPAHFISQITTVSEGMGWSKLINGKMEYQFVWNDKDQQINGPTALKKRLLEQLGWKIVNIPFWEWYALENDPEKEDEYCRSVLSRV